WVDASGKRTDVPARRVGETIELVVAHAVVEASAFPAVLDPIISPEFGMDAPVFMGQKQGQARPAAAPLGDNYLVVWTDVRVGTAKADIYGARVSPLGEVLDPVGFLICGAAEVQDWPDLASHATGALVVWHDYRNGAGPSWDIYGSRISLDG